MTLFTGSEFLHNSKYTVFGVDEAGRGPLAGPLSVAIVSFAEETLNQIHSGQILSGLTDSKKISAKKRNLLYQQIHHYASRIEYRFISNKFIDKFGISYSIYAGIQSLFYRVEQTEPYFLIDGNYNFQKWQMAGQSFSYTSIVRGDSKVASIAAASIIAKVERDEYIISMAKKYPEYGLEKHKGYGTKYHREQIGKYGYSKIHRKSFRLKK